MGKKYLQLVVLVVGVLVFYATLQTVFVSLWANNFEFRYYYEETTPQGIYNILVYFTATMLTAMAAGALFESMRWRGYRLQFAAIVSITALAFVYHWTSPIVEYLSYQHPDARTSFDIFTASPWRGQWRVDFEEIAALAIASTVLFVFEILRRNLRSAMIKKEASNLLATAGGSI